MSATGLAIDGGMAAGAYREAQNAADAGALAAARTEYRDQMQTPPTNSTLAELTGVAQTEVGHNHASWGSITATPNSNTTWAPTSTTGVTSQSAFAAITTSLPAQPPQVDKTTIVLNANYAQAQTQYAPTGLGGSTSSANDYMTYANATQNPLSQWEYLNCASSVAKYHFGNDTQGTVDPGCSGGTLPAQVTSAGTMLSSVNPSTDVQSDNAPSASSTITVANETQAITGVASASASVVQSGSQQGWSPKTGLTSSASTSATNVQVTTQNVDVSASSLMMSMTVSFPPGATSPVVTPTCAPTTLNFSAGVGVPLGSILQSVPLDSSCNISGTLPVVPGTTITSPWYSPSNYNNACSYNALTGTWSCSLQSCLLQIVVPVTVTPAQATDTTVCLGQVVSNFSVQALTISSFVGAVTVNATVPQPTYFMRVAGISQTSPTAQATADIEGITDESSAAFLASPFGMPADATEMDSPFQYRALQPGHRYYLWGPNMYSYSPSALGSSFEGQLANTSGHAVGSTVTSVGGLIPNTAAPLAYGVGQYFLEPVFDPTSLRILYYGVFEVLASDPLHTATLVNSMPVTTASGAVYGPIVQSLSTSGWIPFDQGAVSIKLEG